MKYITLSFFFLLLTSPLHAQSDDSWKLYDDTSIARIDITIDTSSLAWIYNNVESDSEHYAQFRFRNRWIDESMDSIGFRLRGNTSRSSAKKSFKISFNSFIKGRKFHGVKDLNVNGEHNDPSIIRSKLCFDLYRDVGFRTTRASHARLYINNQYYGLYISVEDIGEEFLKKNFADDSGNLWKCLYPADLSYLGDDPTLYVNLTSGNRPVYELQTNEDENDFSQLARLIKAINTTSLPSMADSLESLLDVPAVLKYFAMNVLTGSWDDYRSLMNNYYLYYNPGQNQFTVIPYDYDNTFGIDWSGNDWTTADPYNFPKVASGARPLSEAILAQNSYRDLFTHFLSFYNTNVLQLSRWEQRIDRIRDTITTAAAEDSFRTLDYGFTMDNFLDSYSSSAYQDRHVKFGLKQFINLRYNSLPAQLQYANAPPQAYNISYTPAVPDGDDTLYVNAACFGKAGIKAVSVYYTSDDSSVQQSYPMAFSPIQNSVIVEETDRWSATIPPLGPGASGTFTVEVTDSLNRTLRFPKIHPIIIRTPEVVGGDIVINELLADNFSIIADSNGEYEDWIELYNPMDSTILLTGMYMTDNPSNKTKWQFTQPNLTIAPDEYLLIWCDDDEAQPGIHTNFKLSADGEYAALIAADGITIIDSISFGAQQENLSYGRFPNGENEWDILTPTPGLHNVIYNSVKERMNLPNNFSLTAFPNPFNPSTTIKYTLPFAGRVVLSIYSINGELVATLVDERQPAGEKGISFEAKGIASGIYFYKLEVTTEISNNKNFVEVGKLVFLK
ncbi:MAG: T9SS type A sorting domain-containing protein [Bacteroidetes bacterium]|nr:MAG: T9SS type A sorting domain-containing protein [Bacteroidota bacterium]